MTTEKRLTFDVAALRAHAAAGGHRPGVLVIAATALAGARDEGCACDPDIEVGSRAGKLAVRVWHDSWCPLARALAARTN